MQNPDYHNLLIEPHSAENLLLELYGIKGEAYPLPGEYDMNFRIRVEDQDQYILKISRPQEDPETLDFQEKLLGHLEGGDDPINAPVVLKDLSGQRLSSFTDHFGQKRHMRLLSWIPGSMFHQVNPKRNDLRFSLGLCCGKLATALLNFDHPKAHREFEWDVANSLWTKSHMSLFTEDQKELMTYFQNRFSDFQEDYAILPKSVIHNDANDHNIVVTDDLKAPKVLALIDYGDAIYSQTINDLAVACAYGIMEQNDPLSAAADIVKGYHEGRKLSEKELPYL